MSEQKSWFARDRAILVTLVFVLNSFIVSAIPVARWTFDEGQGTITADVTGNGNTGTLMGGVTWTTDSHSGYAVRLDGIDDEIQTLHMPSIDLTREVWLEAWIKRDSQQDGNIISRNGPYHLAIFNNKVHGGVYAGSPCCTWVEVTGTTTLALNQWYKVAMGYDGSRVRVYVNDREDGSLPQTGLMPIVSQNLFIGGGSTSPYRHFHGVIDDAGVYNDAGSRFLQITNIGGTSISPLFRTPNNPFFVAFSFLPNQNYYNPNVPPETVVGDLTLTAPFFASRPYYFRYYLDLRDINTPLYYTFENFRFMSRMLYGTLHFDEITSFYIEAQNAQVTVPVVRASLGIPYYVQALAYDGNEFILSDGYRVLVPAMP